MKDVRTMTLRRKHLVGLVALLAVALIGGAALLSPGGDSAPAPTPTPEPPSPITAKGLIQPVRQSNLSFRTLGQIAVLPKVGDRVEADQEIARLDTAELDLAVAQAQDAVAVSQAMLDQTVAPARAEDLAAAQAAYDGAVARHEQLLSGATAADREAAKIAVASAESALQAAQARQRQLGDGPTAAELAAAASAVGAAQAGLAAAEQRQAALDPNGQARQDEVRAAELGLESAKNALYAAQVERDATKGLFGPDSTEGKAGDARAFAAETAVSQARTILETKQKPPTDAEARAAAEAVASAQSELAAARARLKQLRDGATAADLNAAASAVGSAEAGLAAARAKLDQLENGATAEEKAASAAQVAQAKAALDLRKSGAAPADVAVLRARLKQSETALEQAKAARRSALIVSPLGGTVVWSAGDVGDTVQPGEPVLVVADLSALEVETTDLDEASAVLVSVGMPVKVRVNAFAEKVLPGEVVEVAALASPTASGDANYTVRVLLKSMDPALRLGMTTKVEFPVSKE